MKKYFISLLLIAAFSVNAQYNFQIAFPNLTFTNPLDLQHAGDGSNRIFVVEQAGRIKVFPNNSSVTATKIFLDITDRVTFGSETGLLGLAFHPNYENNGYFYVNYTAPSPLRTVVSRFQVSSTNPDSADKNSEQILFNIQSTIFKS
ncbi:MAG: PQQ-dependent sugar dehydrogenase [Ignavibacterium sp.]|uniref:PQQ-dependent sugar dehydrogenase n=1 Tax=Ignavibacterium sp. TaxID=2651167 RepID=UPI004049890C